MFLKIFLSKLKRLSLKNLIQGYCLSTLIFAFKVMSIAERNMEEAFLWEWCSMFFYLLKQNSDYICGMIPCKDIKKLDRLSPKACRSQASKILLKITG